MKPIRYILLIAFSVHCAETLFAVSSAFVDRQIAPKYFCFTFVFLAVALTTAVYGQIIGTEGSTITDTDRYRKEVVFDRDPLTFFDAPAPGDGWAGVDFAKPVSIDHIWYTPRSDGNDITQGDTHELFYWAVGKQIAVESVPVYENVSANALLWIRNLSRGHEERIFTYEKGEQVWW